ncbi:YolD-like family protein [Paenibacillus sp. RC67]|uniref:YolD-like family protein n=1 Tax=Paenibacillus sp. RC67 TaxID=3039392 RepID=UPI0024ADF8B2|nr:YolD-like family protein [Paenibacillus sp. RC67]
MMLPEHKERGFQLNNQANKMARPEFTEDEQLELFRWLKASLVNTIEITITVYSNYGIETYTGIVSGLDSRQYLVKLDWLGDWKLIDFKDIIGAEFSADRC